MRIEGLDTTNMWLGMIAIVSVVQILALAAVAWFGYRLYSRAMTLMNEVEARHIAPIAARANHVLDDVQQITARIRGAEETLREKFRIVAATGGHAVAIAKSRSWPILGILRAARVGLSVLSGREPHTTRSEQPEINRAAPLRSTGSM